MTIISLLVNITVFLLIFNWSYIMKRRKLPNYPSGSVGRTILLPISLGIAYTFLIDVYKGIFYYQLFLFFIVAGFLFWKFGWHK